MHHRSGKTYPIPGQAQPPRTRLPNKAPDMHYVRSGRIAKGRKVERRLKHPEPQGLRNPGFWCYRRSLLQCLLHSPELYKHLLRKHDGCAAQRASDCVFCALRSLANVYWYDQRRFTPDQAVNVLDAALDQRWNTMYDDGTLTSLRDERQQNDPDEFFKRLIDLLQDSPSEEGRIKRLFETKCKIRTQCEICGKVNERVDDEIGMTLPLSNCYDGKELTAYLWEHFDDGELRGVTCDSDECTEMGIVPMTRTEIRRIENAPEILVIHLVRFDFVNGQAIKFREPVEYDELLDMSQWSDRNESLVYAFDGVVAHSGDTADQGHYIAAVRHRGKGGGFSVVSDSSVCQDRGGDFAKMTDPTVLGGIFEP